MSQFDDASILITGGTGSFGKAFVHHLLTNHKPRVVTVFSRDELKQHEMRQEFDDHPNLRWFLGDVRDLPRLHRAFRDVDFVVHAAALKQVDSAEYNPFEFVKTNVMGSQNVIDAAIDAGVKKVVALSTDKASSPINLYGATKLTADKLFVAGNNYADIRKTAFCVVRYGNVMGSRGSVIPLWVRRVKDGQPIPLTDSRMTRFWISLEQAVLFVEAAFADMQGGELFVPRIPSMRLLDLVEAIAPGHPVHEIGLRPGEKLHEEMISTDDCHRTIRQQSRFVVKPTIANWGFASVKGEPVPEGFSYRSDTNDLWLGVEAMQRLLADESPHWSE